MRITSTPLMEEDTGSSTVSVCDSEEFNNDNTTDDEQINDDILPRVRTLEQLRAQSVRQVYLITYSQADIQKFPTRRSFAESVIAAFSHTGLPVKQWVCCRERHRREGQHYHMAVKLERMRRWLAVKSFLHDKHGITVHFSNAHNNYYSAWKYVTKEDEDVIESSDHPDLWNLKAPKTTMASEKRTELGRINNSDISGPSTQPSTGQQPANPKKRKRLSAFELSEIVAEKEIKTRTELLALAQEQKEQGKTDIAEFVVNRGQRVVAELINTTWEIRNAHQHLQRSRKSRLDILRDAQVEECVPGCNGLWFYCASEILEKNGIDKGSFAKAVLELLEKGRGKYRNLLIVGPANTGKTFILNPLTKIFRTFSNPASTTFAWVGAELAECIFLNDFRWSPQVIPWHDFLLMLEGQVVHLPAPKTHYAKDLSFETDTPIFSTGKRTMVYIKNGVLDERETEMMSVRWRVFYFNRQIAEEEQRDVPVCGRCFAHFLFTASEERG